MIKRFQQVRLVSEPSQFGQVAWVSDAQETPTTGPLWEVHVQWGGEGGAVRGHYLSEIRPETFLEFLFRRPGYIGKTAWPWAVWFFAIIILVGFAEPLIAAPFVMLFFASQWLNFKGIFR